MATRNVHFVLYLPDQTSAFYRRTADASHAALTIANVPADISDRVVQIAGESSSGFLTPLLPHGKSCQIICNSYDLI